MVVRFARRSAIALARAAGAAADDAARFAADAAAAPSRARFFGDAAAGARKSNSRSSPVGRAWLARLCLAGGRRRLRDDAELVAAEHRRPVALRGVELDVEGAVVAALRDDALRAGVVERVVGDDAAPAHEVAEAVAVPREQRRRASPQGLLGRRAREELEVALGPGVARGLPVVVGAGLEHVEEAAAGRRRVEARRPRPPAELVARGDPARAAHGPGQAPLAQALGRVARGLDLDLAEPRDEVVERVGAGRAQELGDGRRRGRRLAGPRHVHHRRYACAA